MRISKPQKKLILKITAAVLILVLLVAGIWAFFIEPDRLVVKSETIRLENWPVNFERMRIAVLADLHVGAPHINPEKLQLIVSKVNENKPDLVLLLGDFISSVRGGTVVAPEVIAETLKHMRARYGVFAVLGNHDWWFDGPRVKRALETAGISVLEDDVARIEASGDAIWLVGLGDFLTRRPDVEGTLARVSDTSPVIVLTHNPDLFPRIPSRVGLTLAGHTHGGQVNLPLIGPIWVPSEFGQRYAAGHVVENNHQLFVTTGIGTSLLPIRFRVTPEIVIITLTSAPETAR